MPTTPDSTPITGTLRTTWVRDELAHVLEHADTDEPSGTWTGLACPDHGLSIGSDVCVATLLAMSAGAAPSPTSSGRHRRTSPLNTPAPSTPQWKPSSRAGQRPPSGTGRTCR